MGKRSLQNDNITKRRRVELSLLTLPTDILLICFQYLSPIDVINLSCVNKDFRHELNRVVFSKIKCTWNDLTKLDESSDIIRQSCYISQLRIVDSYSYGEWQIDIFPILHDFFPNLYYLQVNSSSSSNWLKYRESTKITALALYYEPGHRESETATYSLSSTSNPKRINHKLVSTNAKIFNLLHLNKMSNLTSLTLNNYHFNWENESDSHCQVHLHKLSLIDCTWEYPFDISQFNPHNSIAQLSMYYTNNNSFVLLERFTKFLDNPTNSKAMATQELSISFANFDNSWLKPLSTKQFAKFVGKAFPKLNCLKLHGWLLNLRNFNSYLLLLEDNNLKLLDLSIIDSSLSMDINLPVQGISQESKTRFPWMKLVLHASSHSPKQ